jgi:hypothetical protein
MIAYAFPFASKVERSAGETNVAHSQGMTLKDWFAGQIIAALLGSDPSNSSLRDKNGQLCQMEPIKLENMAKTAYHAAEVMMQVRATDQREPRA